MGDVTSALKASYSILYNLPEREFFIDTLSRRELINKMEMVLDSFRPSQVFICLFYKDF